MIGMLMSAGLFAAILALLNAGYILGRHLSRGGERDRAGLGALEGAIPEGCQRIAGPRYPEAIPEGCQPLAGG